MNRCLIPNSKSQLKFASAILVALLALNMSFPIAAFASGAAYHTVTFAENDNLSDPAYSLQTANTPTQLTYFSGLSPTLTYAGHIFMSWNTNPDGTGTTYVDGATYSFGSSTILYAMWSSAFHTVTFAENANPSDTIFSVQTENSPSELVPFSGMNPALTNPGSSFVNWNTSSNGTGVVYTDMSTYDFSSSLVLYAIWRQIPLVTANFLANGGLGLVTSIEGLPSSSVALPSSTGLSNVGYTFVGWNTAANGMGTEYQSGAPFLLTVNQTLYAQWSPDVYVITYLPNGGSNGVSTIDYVFGTPAVSLATPTMVGNHFEGWFSSSSGGLLVGIAGASFTPQASLDLYAHWSPDEYLITLTAEGGTVVPSSINFAYGDSALVLPTPTFSGHTFNGWFTSATSGVQVDAGGVAYSPTASVELFAQWSAVALVVVTFDTNGASGSIPSMSGEMGTTITLPGQTGMLRAGFALSSWNTQSKGSGTRYVAGQTMKLTSAMKLFAQWTGHVPAVLFGAIGVFAKNKSVLTPGLKSQVNRLVNVIRARKYHSISLFGYTATTGLASLNVSLSRSRAVAVATYLRSRLSALRIRNVSIKSAGEGAIPGGSSSHYSRVEVFVL